MMGSAKSGVFCLLLVLAVAVLSSMAAQPAPASKANNKNNKNEEPGIKVVVNTPAVENVAAVPAPEDKTKEEIAGLRAEIDRKSKIIESLESQIHSLEAKGKKAAQATSNDQKAIAEKDQEIKTLTTTVQAQKEEIQTLKNEVSSLRATATPATPRGKKATPAELINELLDWVKEEAQTQKAAFEARLPIWKENALVWKENALTYLNSQFHTASEFVRNDIPPLLASTKRAALLQAEEALDKVENQVEQLLQSHDLPLALPATSSKQIKVGRVVAYVVGVVVLVSAFLFVIAFLRCLASPFRSSSSSKDQSQQGKKKRKTN